MKTGSGLWLAKPLTVFLIGFALILQSPLRAEEVNGSQVKWSDRVSVETDDGKIIDTPPFVSVKGVRLARFALMQSLKLHSTLSVESGEDVETLIVFRAWQGGTSQGEQLMLVSLSTGGLDIIGPHASEFETMEIVPANDDQGPLFLLYGDEDGPHTALEYVAGQLAER